MKRTHAIFALLLALVLAALLTGCGSGELPDYSSAAYQPAAATGTETAAPGTTTAAPGTTTAAPGTATAAPGAATTAPGVSAAATVPSDALLQEAAKTSLFSRDFPRSLPELADFTVFQREMAGDGKTEREWVTVKGENSLYAAERSYVLTCAQESGVWSVESVEDYQDETHGPRVIPFSGVEAEKKEACTSLDYLFTVLDRDKLVSWPEAQCVSLLVEAGDEATEFDAPVALEVYTRALILEYATVTETVYIPVEFAFTRIDEAEDYAWMASVRPETLTRTLSLNAGIQGVWTSNYEGFALLDNGRNREYIQTGATRNVSWEEVTVEEWGSDWCQVSVYCSILGEAHEACGRLSLAADRASADPEGYPARFAAARLVWEDGAGEETACREYGIAAHPSLPADPFYLSAVHSVGGSSVALSLINTVNLPDYPGPDPVQDARVLITTPYFTVTVPAVLNGLCRTEYSDGRLSFYLREPDPDVPEGPVYTITLYDPDDFSFLEDSSIRDFCGMLYTPEGEYGLYTASTLLENDSFLDWYYGDLIDGALATLAATEGVSYLHPLELDPANKQVVFVHRHRTDTGFHWELTLGEWNGQRWVLTQGGIPVHLGSNGTTHDKVEGDHCTPCGTFPILFCFSDRTLETNLRCRLLRDGDVWVTDRSSRYYNTIQSGGAAYKDWSKSENIYRQFAAGRSVAGIYFAYNGDGESGDSATPGAGAALFFDGVGASGDLDSGYGDIKITGAEMLALLRELDAELNPVIVIQAPDRETR